MLAAERSGGSKRDFCRGGGSLSDFIQSQRDEDDPAQIAANILDYFCLEGGRFNNLGIRHLCGLTLMLERDVRFLRHGGDIQ